MKCNHVVDDVIQNEVIEVNVVDYGAVDNIDTASTSFMLQYIEGSKNVNR